MNVFKKIFSTKSLVWQGTDTEKLEKYKNILKENDIWFSAFKVNQNVPKCSGDCGTCAAANCELGDNMTIYEKTKARQDLVFNLMSGESDSKTYAIYVINSDLAVARKLLFPKTVILDFQKP